jgi:hypothetical protein
MNMQECHFVDAYHVLINDSDKVMRLPEWIPSRTVTVGRKFGSDKKILICSCCNRKYKPSAEDKVRKDWIVL